MCVITSELKAGQYRLLEFSGTLPIDMMGQVLINGVKYRTEIVYDMPHSIAVECDDSAPPFIGAELIAI